MTEVWIADTDSFGAIPLSLFDLLDTSEKERAGTIASTQDRRLFVVSRILLRHALSTVLGGSPRDWRFGVGEQGKPILCDSQDSSSVDFNLSHSGSAVAVSISVSRSSEGRVGVDIELVDPEGFRGSAAPLSLFYSARELAILYRLPPALRWKETLRLWTVKEAYAKFLGLGIHLDFSKLEVPSFSSKICLETHLLTVGGRQYQLALASTPDRSSSFSPFHWVDFQKILSAPPTYERSWVS